MTGSSAAHRFHTMPLTIALLESTDSFVWGLMGFGLGGGVVLIYLNFFFFAFEVDGLLVVLFLSFCRVGYVMGPFPIEK